MQVVRHTNLDRGDKLARHHATRDRLGKLEARTARQGLDVEHHIAELTVPARLLLVSTANLDALADGFLVGHLARLGYSVHPIFALEAFERHAQVHLALAPQHHLVRVLGMLEPNRGILLHQTPQRARELHLVLAIFHTDRYAE